jgi:hypothetical protein
MRLIASPVVQSSSIRFEPHHLNTERETTAVAAKATAMATAMATGNAGVAQNNSVCACFGQ